VLEVVILYVEPTAGIEHTGLEPGGVPFRGGQREVDVDELVIEVLPCRVKQPGQLAK
jgi:hypothetical protein